MSTAIPRLDVDPFAIDTLISPYAVHQALRDAGPIVWLERYRNAANMVFRSDDANCRFSAMISGVGQAILPSFLADQVPGVTRIHGPDTVGSIELWLATHKETRHVARMRMLVDFLVKLTRDRRQRLAGRG